MRSRPRSSPLCASAARDGRDASRAYPPLSASGLWSGGLARAKAPSPASLNERSGSSLSRRIPSSGPPTGRSSAASAPVPTRPSRRCSRAASPRSPRSSGPSLRSRGASEQRPSSRSGSTRTKPSSTTSARHYRGTPRRPPRPALPSSSSSPTWSSEGYEGCSSRFSRRSGVTSARTGCCASRPTPSSYVTAPDPRSARRSSSTTRTSTSPPHRPGVSPRPTSRSSRRR